MTTKKALPNDVENFFKGDSVFFSPSPTEGSHDKEAKLIPPKEKASHGESKNVTTKKPSSISPKKVVKRDTVSSSEPNERTDKPNAQTERSSIILELEEGVKEVDQRRTERYSFEIYIDQIGTIEDLQYKYKKKTGKRLSSSRIIREALDEYLKQAEKTI